MYSFSLIFLTLRDCCFCLMNIIEYTNHCKHNFFFQLVKCTVKVLIHHQRAHLPLILILFCTPSSALLLTRCQRSASEKVVNTSIKRGKRCFVYLFLEAHKANCTYYIYSIYKVVYFGSISVVDYLFFFAKGQ